MTEAGLIKEIDYDSCCSHQPDLSALHSALSGYAQADFRLAPLNLQCRTVTKDAFDPQRKLG
jgi:hypothetical protein